MSRIFRYDFLILAAEVDKVNILSLESEFERHTACSQLLGYLKQLGYQLAHFKHLGCYSESIKCFCGYLDNIFLSVSLSVW